MRTYRLVDWMKLLVAVSLVPGLVASVPCSASAAAKYPTRPIQVVIGYEPGSSDAAMKVLTDRMAEVLGQPMPFVYKPGGAGSIGATYVAKSKPDGYTIANASVAPLITSPLTMKGLDYSLEDFIPICRISVNANALVVKGDARWKTMKEFLDEAKKNPGKLSYATSGLFGTVHIPMAQLERAAGTSMTHIPTTGSGPSATAVMGGHVDMACCPMMAVASHLKAGTLRSLAFVDKQRLPDFPNVPTLVELGYPITYRGWNALLAPKGVPNDIMQILYKAADQVIEKHGKAIGEYLRNMSITFEYTKGEELGKEIRAQYDQTKKIIEEFQKPAK